MDRTLALPQNTCYFSYLHSHHCPFHFFYHFYPVIKAPSHYKASRAIGLDPDSRGLQCKYTKPWDERAHSHSRTGVHYTTLPLPFAFAFQYPQYINHFPFVSSLCQSESQHTSSTSSPKTLTKQKTITNPRHHWTQPHLSFAPSHSDPQFGSQWRRILWILSFPLPGWYPPSPPRPGSGSSAMNSHRFLTIQVRHWLQNLVAEFKFYEMLKVESMCNTSENSRLTWVALHKSHGFPVLYNLTQLCLNTHFKYCSQG